MIMYEKLWPKGVKKTKQRMSVFEILMEAKTPLTAMDIFSKTEQFGTEIWLSTVYRVLELFVEKDLIERHILSGSDMALYELKEKQHKHYAICMRCQKMIVLEECPISDEISVDDFQITDHKVEIHGYCGSCVNTNSN